MPDEEVVVIVARNLSQAPPTPSIYAARLATEYAATATDAHKKGLGQFFTPASLGAYLASLATFTGTEVRLLDPGFGAGILACSLIEHLVQTNPVLTTIHLDAYDIDTGVLPYAQDALDYLTQWLGSKGITLHAHLFDEDFILAQEADWQLFPLMPITPRYDIVIANPPYFKIGNEDPRNLLMSRRQLEQRNIYALFVVKAVLLTHPDGELLFLIPRSFCSGLYFEQFRAFLYQYLRFEQFHLFHSREHAFENAVLQENIIFKATRVDGASKLNYSLHISSSTGTQDLTTANQLHCTLHQIVDFNSREKALFLPTTPVELTLISDFKTWGHRLIDFSIEVSTGPVVAFRTRPFLREKARKGRVPLFWIEHVRRGVIDWPNNGARHQYLAPVKDKPTSLLPIRNYVLLRRFSAKDDKHRLIAAPFFAAKWSSYETVGFENKLNYLYIRNGQLSEARTAGLAALLNSDLYNTFFQIFNGNTQVSATEVRALPMPPIAMIEYIGQQVLDKGLEAVDSIVNEVLKH